MHKRSKELVDYGRLCGFVLEGQDGSEHYTLKHPNGSVVKVACSPGDRRGDENCRAEMRRKSGFTPPRANSGSYRQGVGRRERTGHLANDNEVADGKRWAAKRARHGRVVEELIRLQGSPPSTGLTEARPLARELLAIEAEFDAASQPVPIRRGLRLLFLEGA